MTDLRSGGQDYAQKVHYVDGIFNLESLQTLTSANWQAWITDRLHWRISFASPDPRQGESPEYLFLDLIPQLGQYARETAEIGIDNALAAAIEDNWSAQPLIDLLFLIRRLGVCRCSKRLYTLARRLETSIGTVPPADSAEDPYHQCLAALAKLQNLPEGLRLDEKTWHELIAPNPNTYFTQAFRALSSTEPAAALRLLQPLDWQDRRLSNHISGELESFFGKVDYDKGLAQILRSVLEKKGESSAIAAALLEKKMRGWAKRSRNIAQRQLTSDDRNHDYDRPSGNQIVVAGGRSDGSHAIPRRRQSDKRPGGRSYDKGQRLHPIRPGDFTVDPEGLAKSA